MLRETGIKEVKITGNDSAIVQGSIATYDCYCEDHREGVYPKIFVMKDKHKYQYQLEKTAIENNSSLTQDEKDDAFELLENKYLDKKVMVKGGPNTTSIGEVLVSKVCENICDENNNIDYVPYGMAQHIDVTGSPSLAITCPSFFQNGITANMEWNGKKVHDTHEALGFRKNDKFEELDYYHTIDGYNLMLNELFNQNKDPRITDQINQTMTHMKKQAIVDYLTCQSDRHFGNFGFFIDKSKGHISPIPSYDFGNCFGLGNHGRRPFGLDRHMHKFGRMLDKVGLGDHIDKIGGVLDKIGLGEQGGILRADDVYLTGIHTPLMPPDISNDHHKGKRPRFPNDKHANPPREAILDPNTQELIVDPNTPAPREMTSSDKKLMSETFENELAEMIVENPELSAFYQKARSLNMSQILEEVNTLAGQHKLSAEQSQKILKLWEERVRTLDDKCTFLDKNFFAKNEKIAGSDGREL